MGDLSDFHRGEIFGGVQLERQKTNGRFIRCIQSSFCEGNDGINKSGKDNNS